MENLEVSLSCLGFICRHADRSQRELKALLSKQVRSACVLPAGVPLSSCFTEGLPPYLDFKKVSVVNLLQSDMLKGTYKWVKFINTNKNTVNFIFCIFLNQVIKLQLMVSFELFHSWQRIWFFHLTQSSASSSPEVCNLSGSFTPSLCLWLKKKLKKSQ